VARKSDNKAAGSFTGHSYGEGNVPAGSWIVLDGTEPRYKVTEKITFRADAGFRIPVEAEFAGSDYNIGAGMPARITRFVPGLDSVSAGAGWQKQPGENAESDDSYRGRVKNRWRSQIPGNTKETYRYYAEAVAGVRGVKIIRTPRGPGSTDIIIASVAGLPAPELLSNVEAALRDRELMGFDVRIKAPDVVSVDVAVEYAGDADEAAVALVAQSYVHNLGIGGRFSIRDLYALYEPLGLATLEILSPERDVRAGGASIIMAAINVSKAAP
jgi:uncharacterized phage protein gp47/JayE